MLEKLFKNIFAGKFIFIGLLAILLTLPASSLFAAKDSNATQKWFVLSPESATQLLEVLPVGKILLDGFKVSSIKINKDNAKVCVFDLNHNLKYCAFLYHPKQAFKNDLAAGVFKIHFKAQTKTEALWKAVGKNLAQISKSPWNKAGLPSLDYANISEEWNYVVLNLINMNRVDLAESVTREIERIAGHNQNTKLIRVLIMYHQDKKAEAFEILEKLEQDGSDDPFRKMIKSSMLLFGGDIEGVNLLEESLHNLPKASVSKCRTVESFAKSLPNYLGQDKAIQLWKKLGVQFSACTTVSGNLVEQMLEWGINEQALVTAEDFLKIPGMENNVESLLTKVIVLRRIKENHKALATLNKINKIIPDDEEIISLHSTIASSIEGDGKSPYRDKMLALAKKDPKNLFASHAAAVMSYYLGDYKTVIPIMDRLKTQLPKNARVYIYGAMSRYELGDWDGAKKWLDELETLNANDSDIYYCEAVLWSSKDTEKSRKAIEKYLAIPPNADSYMLKRQKAWEFWEMLKDGKIPPSWIAGSGNFRLKASEATLKDENSGSNENIKETNTNVEEENNEDDNDEGNKLPYLLTLLAGIIIGLFVGRKKLKS